MPAGRPRTATPSPEECIELGKDFVQWATEPTKEWRCLVGQWYCLKHGILKKDWKLLKQNPQFSPYYEMGMAALAKKALDGTMEKSFGHRYIRLYDQELVEAENDQAKFEADLRKIEEKKEDTKFVFEVNYANDSKRPIKIPSKTIPDRPVKKIERRNKKSNPGMAS